MNQPINKTGKVAESLAEQVKNKLKENNASKILEQSPEDRDEQEMIENHPFISIASSLYLIERTMKANLYLNLCQSKEQPFRQEVFDAILGGPDPELVVQAEIDRLKALNEKERKAGQTGLDNPNKDKSQGPPL